MDFFIVCAAEFGRMLLPVFECMPLAILLLFAVFESRLFGLVREKSRPRWWRPATGG
jgi:hypothetical protein